MELKAQTQVITIVLISGIVISLVGTAYMWGIPLISKRTSITDFLAAEDFVLKLNDKIVEIANSGSGETTLNMQKGLIRVIDTSVPNDPNDNSVIYEIIIDQPVLSNGSVVILKTNVIGETATYGEAEPRVLSVSSDTFSAGQKLKVKLHYRELVTKTEPKRGYKISLERGTIAGTSQIRISYSGTQVMPGGAANGGDLIVTKIRIDVF
jgi:hypothetical protein